MIKSKTRKLLLIFFSIVTINLQPAAYETKETKDQNDVDIFLNLIANKEFQKVKLIIKNKKLNLDLKSTKRKLTPLHIACGTGFIDLAKLSLEQGANVDATQIDGATPLMYACQYGFLDIVKLLLKYGANVNAKKTSDETPLMYACQYSSPEIVNLLLENGADVNAKKSDGCTSLMLACQKQSIDIIKLLLKHGADINASEELLKNTALSTAIHKGSVEITQLLLQHKANPNIKLKDNITPLMLASIYNIPDIVYLLLEHGARTNSRNTDGYTALNIAEQKEFTDIVNLIKNRKLINRYSKKIFTAYEKNQFKTCEIYLNEFLQMVDSDELFLMLKHNNGNNLLHEAVIKKDYSLIDCILNYNPEVMCDLLNMPNNNDMTPIDLAVSDEYLLKYFMRFAYPPKNSFCTIL